MLYWKINSGVFFGFFMNRITLNRLRKKQYDANKINLKHNLWRIENDLNWIFKKDIENSLKTKICLYWLDINLKNTFFPWVLKIERELKSYFVSFYKKRFSTNSALELLNQENYSDISNQKNPLKILIEKNIKEKSIDEVVFTLTFGEFVNLLIFFNDYIKTSIANELNLNLSIFINVIKYFIILRNAIAHNKTIIKIRDEKNNKRFSLKKDFFDFEISKQDIDILSTNASGSIYVVKIFLERLDSKKKSSLFIKDVKKNLKIFNKTINNKHSYEQIINQIFLSHYKNILKI